MIDQKTVKTLIFKNDGQTEKLDLTALDLSLISVFATETGEKLLTELKELYFYRDDQEVKDLWKSQGVRELLNFIEKLIEANKIGHNNG